MASSSSTSRRLQDWALSFFGLSIVVSGMAAIDDTSRQYVFKALHGDFPSIPSAYRPHEIWRHIAEVLPVGDTSFVAFAIIAFVLVIFMFRM